MKNFYKDYLKNLAGFEIHFLAQPVWQRVSNPLVRPTANTLPHSIFYKHQSSHRLRFQITFPHNQSWDFVSKNILTLIHSDFIDRGHYKRS